MENTRNDVERKKAFDATVCFSFFGTWLEAIEAYETEADTSSNAYKLFKAIAYYSMYGVEPEFENSGLDAMWKILSREIDNSVSRRKCRFGKEEVTEREQAVIDAWKVSPHASVREVAMTTGIHRSSVERIKRKYWRQLEEVRRTAIAAGDSDIHFIVLKVENDCSCIISAISIITISLCLCFIHSNRNRINSNQAVSLTPDCICRKT